MKIKQLMILALILGLVSCGNDSLVSEDEDLDPDASTTAAFTVQSVHHRSPDEDGNVDPAGFHHDGQLVFTVGHHHQATMVHLDQAVISWKNLKLISDGDDPECATGVEVDIPLNTTESFLTDDLMALNLGQAFIPLITYCQYRITVAPLRDEATHEDMMLIDPELAYLFSGTLMRDGQEYDFMVEGTEAVSVQLNFQAKENGETIDHPLHFVAGETSSQLLFGNKYDYILSGVENLDLDDPELNQQLENLIFENFQIMTHQHLGAHHTHSTDDSDEDHSGDDHSQHQH